MKHYIAAMKKWNDFNGRSGRAEFWIFQIFYVIMGVLPL